MGVLPGVVASGLAGAGAGGGGGSIAIFTRGFTDSGILLSAKGGKRRRSFGFRCGRAVEAVEDILL